ncbi:MAG TPA: hypothetical protein VE077_11035 [Candidatus Methylomirabilis sp.]|nr:hypothetical protein [Candidatus Methylomirabilis sp.]
MSAKKPARSLRRTVAAALLATLTLSAWTTYRVWPRRMSVGARNRVLSPRRHGHRLIVPFARDVACAQVGSFEDQLEAFLRFEYLRGRDPEEAAKILLAANHSYGRTTYKIYLLVDNDLLTTTPHLNRLRAQGLIARYELISWSPQELARAEEQSHMFETAYNLPSQQRLENLPSFQLVPALADFLVFKSQTDWRVVGKTAGAPQPLTHRQALRTASDILDVAHFYDLPLDYFLGVGAMENNYMDVNGDLTHAVWKARAERGDIVLQRHRQRVLVSDYSTGAWQISRETLRRAHQLYLKDKRSYDQLPPRLHPPRQFDVNSVDSSVLTTYAGLLLRDLLDHFGGDVERAIGAYNGGVGNPNPAYAAGVRNVALYARRVLEHTPLPGSESRGSVLPNGTAL